jgi:uncharacterized repeat protein (TIGR01451 family)
MSLGWATDQEDPGLESAPNLDSTDGGDLPMHVDAALSVSKSVDNPTPSTGSYVTYTVVVSNGGPAIARNVELTDLLPAGLSYQSHSASQGTYNNTSGLWSVGNLADGDRATLTITVQVTAAGPITITNTATIPVINQPDPNLLDNTDNTSIYVGAPPPNEADLSVLKYVDNHLPYEGETIVFTVVVENTGPATATNISVTDQLPGNLTYQSHSTLTGEYNSGTGVWIIPSLANGAAAMLTITATVNAGTSGSATPNVATITALDQTDPDSGDNSAMAEFFPTAYEANLSVLKTVNNALPYEGSPIIFTVAVQNAGPVTATNIEVADQLPTAVTYQSHSATAGSYSDSTGIWAIPMLGSGAIATLTIRATVNAGTAGSTSFNTASVTASDQPDLDPAGDTSTAGFTPREAPAWSAPRGVPPFPSIYAGIGAAIGAGILAYFVRRRLIAAWRKP